MAEQSLFEIKQNLYNLVDALDEQDGEFTDEQLEQLKCCKEDFIEKIKSYYYLSKKLEADLLECKTEKQRIDSYRKSKENKLNKLKNIIIDNINEFGNINNNGVKYIDFGVFTLSLRQSNSIEPNDLRIQKLISYILTLFADCKDSILSGEILFTPDYILNFVNSCAKSNSDLTGLNYEPYTIDDINTLSLNITSNFTLTDLINLDEYKYILLDIATNDNLKVTADIDKNVYKDLIKRNYNITIVSNNNKQNLNVK